MPKKHPQLEDLPGVFLVAVWFSSLPEVVVPPLTYFLVEGENIEGARKLIEQYLTKNWSHWEIESLSPVRILRES